MVSPKGKRRLVYKGGNYLWFVCTDEIGSMRINILSEDKTIRLNCPFFDTEVPVTPAYIVQLLDKYFAERQMSL